MTHRSELLGVAAAGRYSRQITTVANGTAAAGAAGATSLSVAWPTTAGAIAGNVRNILWVALKPGTANGGSVATPAGWTALGNHIGGGYGGTLADATGNTRIYGFYRDNDNTASGSVAVTITPDGANGVAAGCIQRIQKTSAVDWQAIVVATAEATADVAAGVYAPALLAGVGDLLAYGFAVGNSYAGNALLSAGDGLSGMSPSMAFGAVTTSGYDLGIVGSGRRLQRGQTIGAQTLTLPSGVCRGPLLVARFRVR